MLYAGHYLLPRDTPRKSLSAQLLSFSGHQPVQKLMFVKDGFGLGSITTDGFLCHETPAVLLSLEFLKLKFAKS